MHRDIGAKRGDVAAVKGRRIGAAPWVEMGLRRLLIASGIDLERDRVAIGPVPGAAPAPGTVVNFGVTAARALEEKKIDGFWANGMGAEVAVRSGAGTVVLDVRRGDGPPECFNYTMASVAVRDSMDAETAAPAVRAIVNTQTALKNDHTLATQVGRKLFPPREAELIAELIRRDLPYYDATISRDFVSGMNAFTRDLGLLRREVPYEEVVATECAALWR
jgi:ABC-type nitrate/sulfonate/bicarbonate transport system substrate-binding protein